MADLSFARTITYDNTKPSITLPVTLRANGRDELTRGKFDTGATFCVFGRIHGERLGLNVEAGIYREMEVASGAKVDTFGHEVYLDCAGFGCEAVVYFTKYFEFPRNLLGRVGWMNRLRFALIEYDGLIHLSRHDDL